MAEAKLTIKAVDEATAVMKGIQHNIEGMVASLKTIVSFEALERLGEMLKEAGESVLHFVESESEMAKDLENLSQKTGVTVGDLQTLQFAFRTNGIEVEALETALKFLNKAIATNDPALKQLGVSSRDTFSALMQAAQGLDAITDPAERVRMTMEVFGARGGTKTIPVLLEMARAFGAVSEQARITGNRLDDEMIGKLVEMHEALEKVSLRWRGLWNVIAVGVSPQITGTLTVLTKLVDALAAFERLPILGKLGAVFAGGEIRLPSGPPEMLGPGNEQGIREALRQQEEQARQAAAAAAALLKFRNAVIDAANAAQREAPPGLRPGPLTPEQQRERERARASVLKLQTQPVEQPPLQFGDWAEKAIANAERVKQALFQVRDAIFFGFSSVFANLTNKAQTFRGAIKTMFDAVIQGVLQMVAELLASQAVKMLFNFLGALIGAFTGNPIIGAAVAGVGDLGANVATGESKLTASPNAAQASSGGGGNTFVIQTLSPRDVLGELISPSGSMRTANSRIVEIAAASG
jgi:hypothetical protein